MTVSAERPAIDLPEPPPPRSRWWTIPRLVIATLVIAILAAVITALTYANTYQPLGDAGFTQDGPTMRHNMRVVTDHLGDNTYVAVGPAGGSVTTSYTIANDGRFDIEVLGADNADTVARLRLEWAPTFVYNKAYAGNTSPAYPHDARPFPARIRAHQAITLFVTVHKPGCAPNSYLLLKSIPIKWKALGVHHVTELHLAADSFYYPIAICAPASALKLATD